MKIYTLTEHEDAAWTTYTMTNTTNPDVTVEKQDATDASKLLAGASFTLRTTDAEGRSTITRTRSRRRMSPGRRNLHRLYEQHVE